MIVIAAWMAPLWHEPRGGSRETLMSKMVARRRQIPIAASLREFIISRGRRTRWPTSDELDAMDEARFERYVSAVGLDRRITRARDSRKQMTRVS